MKSKKIHTDKAILETFKRVDEGKVDNAMFSHANVVMLSKEYYH